MVTEFNLVHGWAFLLMLWTLSQVKVTKLVRVNVQMLFVNESPLNVKQKHQNDTDVSEHTCEMTLEEVH